MSQKPPTRALRENPDLDQLKRQAKELLEAYRTLAGRLRPVAPRRARRRGGYGGHPGDHARHRPLARPAVLTPHPEEPVLKAAAADQLRLLDLQSLDTRLDQLAHRRRTLPEHAALAELDTELGSLRDQKRLDAGQVSSPKELEGLQHEIATLARRQSDLEEIVLDVMERLESAQSRASELGVQQEAARDRAAELTAARDTTTAGIDADATQLGAQRSTQASAIDAALITLYEKIREQQGGVGAAELRQRRCGGCRLELNNVEINELRDADPDEVMRCDECRRILVRTGESGL